MIDVIFDVLWASPQEAARVGPFGRHWRIQTPPRVGEYVVLKGERRRPVLSVTWDEYDERGERYRAIIRLGAQEP